MPSFDLVSRVNMDEVKNALDQVQKEISTRYDFKGSIASIELSEETMFVIKAEDQMRLKSVQELLRQKLAKRGVSPKALEFKDAASPGGNILRQEIIIKQGIKVEKLKELNKLIKASGHKVSSQIQGDELRVSGKKRDDLQLVIAHLRNEVKDIDLQFVNFRD